MRLELQVIQIVPSLLHLFSLSTPVVVLFDHPLADVRAVADDFVWHVAVQTVGDASTTDCVRADARRTFVGSVPLNC